VASLLVVHPLPQASGLPQDLAALAFTSANAVRAFASWTPQRSAPVFAVGDSTAEAARLAGFTDVTSAGGDVAALAARIAAERPRGPLLHPCAAEAAGDLAGGLAEVGVNLRALPLYETRPVENAPSDAMDALRDGVVAAVLLHSPKAARVLAGLWTRAAAPDLAQVRLLGLSQACLAPAAHLPFASAVAAAEPAEAALLELLL
jgi:uroporphyrinogen-III synthase